MSARSIRRPGFTVTELLVVVAVIAVIMAILLPALAGVWKTGKMANSINNLKQIGEYMRMYSSDNREIVLPSQFDYSYPGETGVYRGKVRSDPNPQIGDQHQGTWTDILWTVFEMGVFPAAGASPPSGLNNDYRYDSPDKALYELSTLGGPEEINNPLRSFVSNQQDVTGGTGMTPFGSGAQEAGLPGFFAANNFFNAAADSPTFNGWYTNGQIRVPERSMYLVDSFAGETIEDEPEPFDNRPGSDTLEVEFRYPGPMCLMLYLDGHVGQESPWTELDTLESSPRNVIVRDLIGTPPSSSGP
jgi:prepilin-type N-terminal cleavage/methylation domain-containing protein